MPPPTLDVIIPAYNAAAVLGDTIQSVLAQTRPPRRVVVVNDGSTDDTGEVAAGFGPSVVVFRQPNGRQGAARDTGAGSTDAELLLFIDSDDLLLPTALADLTDALLARPDAVAAYCRADLWDGDRPPTRRPDALPDADGAIWRRLLAGNFIRTPGCVLIRADALRAAGGWDRRRQISGHEDWDLWLRLARRGSFVRLPRPLVLYRTHQGSFSSNGRQMTASLHRVARDHRRVDYADPADRALARRVLRPHPARRWPVLVRLGNEGLRRSHYAAGGRLLVRAASQATRGMFLRFGIAKPLR